MKTNFIFVTNIPKSQRSSHMLKDIDNRWAKIICLDNPNSELKDAFIYNPTLHVSHFDRSIAKLRTIEIDGAKPLKVFYVWFPPVSVVITTMIPHGAILLPYLLIDCIPKNAEEIDVIGDLPFRANDFKQWDIPYKDDKWMLLRLPTNQDETTRNYVLSYIRNKKLASGGYPRVTEIFVTEDTRLSKTMVPKHLKSLCDNITRTSNLIFLYDLPAKIASHSIADALKHLDFRNCRVSLIDTVDSLRLGFIYTPNSLPEYRLTDLMERLKTMEIDVPNVGGTKLNFCEVWLQPVNCLPPNVKDRSSYSKAEFILTNYLYIHNLSLSVQPCDLTQRCPIPIRVHLYTIPETDSQFGYITLQDTKDSRITKVLDYLRSLVCDGLCVLVDEIWTKVYNLPEISERRPMLISRTVPFKNRVMISRATESMDIMEGLNLNIEVKIRLADEPAMSCNLMKSSLIFMMNLPDNYNGERLISELQISPSEIAFMDTSHGRVGFLFHRQVSDQKWVHFLDRFCYTMVGKKRMTVKEVYLQSDETVDLIQLKLPATYLSNYVFIYNRSEEGEISLSELADCDTIVGHCTLTTCSGVRCVVVQLQDVLTPTLVVQTLARIRATKICDRYVHAELMWLANIEVCDALAVEPVVNCLAVAPHPIRPKQIKKELL